MDKEGGAGGSHSTLDSDVIWFCSGTELTQMKQGLLGPHLKCDVWANVLSSNKSGKHQFKHRSNRLVGRDFSAPFAGHSPGGQKGAALPDGGVPVSRNICTFQICERPTCSADLCPWGCNCPPRRWTDRLGVRPLFPGLRYSPSTPRLHPSCCVTRSPPDRMSLTRPIDQILQLHKGIRWQNDLTCPFSQTLA